MNAALTILDGTALTTLRTPAVSVAAVRTCLLRGDRPHGDEFSVVTFGAGPQAIGHVDTLTRTLAPDRVVSSVRYVVRDPGKAAVPRRSGQCTEVVRAGTSEAATALRAADVVICATTARDPLFDSGQIADTAVVVAVGSHEPDAREIGAEFCRRAVVVVEDVTTALREAGDVTLAVADGALDADALVPMCEVVTGEVSLPDDRPVLFKSVGMSWQDLVVAQAVIAGFARSSADVAGAALPADGTMGTSS
jgi:ornithine cyclodeaminase/alanine dehydrogenase-like protein (mu-crystallin family)